MKWFLALFFVALTTVYTTAKPPKSRIIGGQAAFAGEFPYAAAIYITTPNGNYFCGGSLLAQQWILTAGQCVQGATVFTILLGTHKLNGDSSTVQRLSSDSYVVHPDFDPITLENDIGLIRLRFPVTITSYIRQLNLPLNQLPPSTVGIALGWGQTSDSNSTLADTLNYVNLAVIPDSDCRRIYGDQLGDNTVCFDGSYNQGICIGDSGSPIIQYVNRGYTVVIAVASFFSGNGCESTDPSGYTKIYPYNDWIRGVIASKYN